MHHRSLTISGLFGILLALPIVQAQAQDSVPAAASYSQVLASSSGSDGVPILSLNSSSDLEASIAARTPTASSTVKASAATPFLSTTTSALDDGSGNPAFSSAVAALIYDFQVTSGSPGPVPLQIEYQLALSRSGLQLGSGSASISIYDPASSNQLLDQIAFAPGDGQVGSLSDHNFFSLNALPGQFYIVTLNATSDAQAGTMTTAYADPYIFIDPSYAAAHTDASLRISPGVGNSIAGATGVPEPGSWAMLASGFGLIGWRSRRAVRGGRGLAKPCKRLAP